MYSVKSCSVPTHTLLDKYSSMDGAYVDCYSTEILGEVTFSEFIFAFYTTLLFKLERFILKLVVSKPSTDNQARQLSDGAGEKFAAWRVENRNENELLMCDFRGRTRSWLMTIPARTVNGPRTRLYFGSAIVPIQDPKTGEPSLEFGFQALLGFHKVYSVLLLYFAKSRINRQRSTGAS
jgi:hypothetical protein